MFRKFEYNDKTTLCKFTHDEFILEIFSASLSQDVAILIKEYVQRNMFVARNIALRFRWHSLTLCDNDIIYALDNAATYEVDKYIKKIPKLYNKRI